MFLFQRRREYEDGTKRSQLATSFQVKLNKIRPAVPRKAPIQSILPDLSNGVSYGRSLYKMAKATVANKPLGFLVLGEVVVGKVFHTTRTTHKKRNRPHHGVNWVKIPARTAPTYPPIGAAAPKIPRQKLRDRPGGKVVLIMATAFGRIRAPPMPVKPRAILKARKDRQAIFKKDHSENQAPPSSCMFLWPYTEPRRPLMRTKVPRVSLRYNINISETVTNVVGLAFLAALFLRTDNWRPPS